MVIYQATVVSDTVEIKRLELTKKQDVIIELNFAGWYDNALDDRVGVIYAGTKKDIMQQIKWLYGDEEYFVTWTT